MADQEWAQYPLRVPPVVMDALRALAKRQRRSLNAVMGAALADYVRRQNKGRTRRRMRWQFDGTEYNTETAEALAHSGKSRHGDEPERVLYKGSSSYTDEYWMVATEEDEGGREFVALTTQDAYQVYLGMHVHLVDEEEAFEFADANSES